MKMDKTKQVSGSDVDLLITENQSLYFGFTSDDLLDIIHSLVCKCDPAHLSHTPRSAAVGFLLITGLLTFSLRFSSLPWLLIQRTGLTRAHGHTHYNSICKPLLFPSTSGGGRGKGLLIILFALAILPDLICEFQAVTLWETFLTLYIFSQGFCISRLKTFARPAAPRPTFTLDRKPYLSLHIIRLIRSYHRSAHFFVSFFPHWSST